MVKCHHAFIVLVMLSFDGLAQTNRIYSNDIEQKIREVETSLAGWVKIKDSSLWTLQDRMAFYHVPGVSIAVIKDYKVQWTRGYGQADSADGRKVTTATKFQAASISKSINALGVLRVATQKQVDLHKDINKYLRTWKLPSDSFTARQKVTLAHLLSHTAGLSVHGFSGYNLRDSLPSDNDILDGRRPANSPAVRNLFSPGVKYQYSGGGIVITKKLITDLTGMTYDSFMNDSVLKPIGMLHSSFSQPPPANWSADLATGYNTTAPVPGKFNIYPEQAPDGLWTTPEDLGRFIIEVQKSLIGKSNKILSKEMTATMLTPYIDKSSALGVFIETRGEKRYFRHGGSNNGFKCEYIASLVDGYGVVVMTNSDEYNIIPEIINSVASVYQWKDFYKPVKKNVVQPDTSKLKDYVGEYTLGNITLQFKLQNEHLYISQQSSLYSRVYFETDDTFFIYLAPGSTVSFVRNKQSQVTHLLIRMGNNEMKALRK